ncbi:MAG: DUF4436 family protein [Microthrixaceae bacterium]|nr:DUF4436 family protein [Microthrixaceae bacterium]
MTSRPTSDAGSGEPPEPPTDDSPGRSGARGADPEPPFRSRRRGGARSERLSGARWTPAGGGRGRLRRQVAPITNLGVRQWPEHRTRPIRNMLIMIVLIGPVLGLGVAVTSIPAGPTDQVLTAGGGADTDLQPDEVAARITLLNPDLGRGELTARVVIQPGSDMISNDDLTLTRTVRVTVGDIAGQPQRVFETGTRIEPITATLQLSGSRLTRYPVDNYLTDFFLLVQREVDPGEGRAIEGDPEYENVPIMATVQSSLSDLRVTGIAEPTGASQVLTTRFELNRPRSVVIFAVTLMGLAWLLALGCVGLAWGVLVRAQEIPVWCWGFYAGVLFALPQLRNGLPGSPPFGSIIDWAIYYWALGLVGLSLLALILAGNVAIRNTHPVDESLDHAPDPVEEPDDDLEPTGRHPRPEVDPPPAR